MIGRGAGAPRLGIQEAGRRLGRPSARAPPARSGAWRAEEPGEEGTFRRGSQSRQAAIQGGKICSRDRRGQRRRRRVVAAAEVEGAGASVLVAFRLVICTLIGRMGRVTPADHVPQVLCGLRQAGSQHPDQGQDEATCRHSTHARIVSGSSPATDEAATAAGPGRRSSGQGPPKVMKVPSLCPIGRRPLSRPQKTSNRAEVLEDKQLATAIRQSMPFGAEVQAFDNKGLGRW